MIIVGRPGNFNFTDSPNKKFFFHRLLDYFSLHIILLIKIISTRSLIGMIFETEMNSAANEHELDCD